MASKTIVAPVLDIEVIDEEVLPCSGASALLLRLIRTSDRLDSFTDRQIEDLYLEVEGYRPLRQTLRVARLGILRTLERRFDMDKRDARRKAYGDFKAAFNSES